MTWVYYADRKPTEADADNGGKVFTKFPNDCHTSCHFSYVPNNGIAWLDPKLLSPLPPRKIWRTPTQADLIGKTEPIPCRCKWKDDERWRNRLLMAVTVTGGFAIQAAGESGENLFHGFDYCEIEVDA